MGAQAMNVITLKDHVVPDENLSFKAFDELFDLFDHSSRAGGPAVRL